MMRKVDFTFSLTHKDLDNFKEILKMMNEEDKKYLKLIYPIGEIEKNLYNIAIRKEDTCEIVHLLEKMRELDILDLRQTIFVERMINKFNNRVEAEAGLLRMKLKYSL